MGNMVYSLLWVMQDLYHQQKDMRTAQSATDKTDTEPENSHPRLPVFDVLVWARLLKDSYDPIYVASKPVLPEPRSILSLRGGNDASELNSTQIQEMSEQACALEVSVCVCVCFAESF